VKNINMVLSLYVFEILNLKRDNIVGCAEDIAQGAEESNINLKLRRDSEERIHTQNHRMERMKEYNKGEHITEVLSGLKSPQ
jgi:hypothetical protein